MILKITLAISVCIHIYQIYDKYKKQICPTLTREEEINLDQDILLL